MKAIQTTSRGQTKIKDEIQKPELVSIRYGFEGNLPYVTYEDKKQGYAFQVIVTRKVAELFRKVVEDYDGNA